MRTGTLRCTHAQPLTRARGAQVREAQLEQYNYILVVGAEEVATRTVNVRSRDNIVHGAMQLEDVAVRLAAECTGRMVHSAFEGIMAEGAEAHAGAAPAAPAPVAV